MHILIGGNKLDRGFTVEGLTVTYMNRPASPQIDTLEQRARAFGYRRDLLPYCQFFATPRTIENLKETVFTEYDLRAELEDVLANGGTVADWASEVGLRLPQGHQAHPRRVLTAISRFDQGGGWHSLRTPDRTGEDPDQNRGSSTASASSVRRSRSTGTTALRTLNSRSREVKDQLLERWERPATAPAGVHEDILEHLRRLTHAKTNGAGSAHGATRRRAPRTREWDRPGFINLFQGATPGNAGSRLSGRPHLFDTDNDQDLVAVQVHRVHPRDRSEITEVFTLGLHIGSRP